MAEGAFVAYCRVSTARQGNLAPIIRELRASGITSFNGIAKAFEERGIPTPRGGTKWSATQIARVAARLQEA